MDRHAELRQHGRYQSTGVWKEARGRRGRKSRARLRGLRPGDEEFPLDSQANARCGEALQINHQIECCSRSQRGCGTFRPVNRDAQRLRSKRTMPANRDRFEQRRERGINPPENLRVAEMQFNKRSTGSAGRRRERAWL